MILNDCIILNLTSFSFILFNLKKIRKISYYYKIEKIYPSNNYLKITKKFINIKTILIKKINKNIKYYLVDLDEEYKLNWKSNDISIRFLNRDTISFNNSNSFKALNTYLHSNLLNDYYKHRLANYFSDEIYKRLILKNIFSNYKSNKNFIDKFISNITNRLLSLSLIIIYLFLPILFILKKIKFFKQKIKKNDTLILHPIIKTNLKTNKNQNINYIENEYSFFTNNFTNNKYLFYKNSIWNVDFKSSKNIIDNKKYLLTLNFIFTIFLHHIKSLYYSFLSVITNDNYYFLFFNILALNEILQKKLELINLNYKYEIIRDDYRANHILRHILNKKKNIYSILIQHHIFPTEYPSIVFAKSDIIMGISPFHSIKYQKYHKKIIPINRVNFTINNSENFEKNTIVIYLPSFRKTSGNLKKFINFFNSLEKISKEKKLSDFKLIFKFKNLIKFEQTIEREYKDIFDKIKKKSLENPNLLLYDNESIHNYNLFKKYEHHLVLGASFLIWELTALDKLVHVYPIKGFENNFFRHYNNIKIINSFENFFENISKNIENKKENLKNLNYDKTTDNFKAFFGKLLND